MGNSFKHSDPHFKRIRNAMNRASNANPGTRCRRCGLTLAERRMTKPNDVWTCGHPDAPGDVGYAPEHRSCNSQLAAQQTNDKRIGFNAGL